MQCVCSAFAHLETWGGVTVGQRRPTGSRQSSRRYFKTVQLIRDGSHSDSNDGGRTRTARQRRRWRRKKPAANLGIISIHLHIRVCFLIILLYCRRIDLLLCCFILFFIFSHFYLFLTCTGVWGRVLFLRAFTSVAENWRESSKISFFHDLWSSGDILTQFRIF